MALVSDDLVVRGFILIPHIHECPVATKRERESERGRERQRPEIRAMQLIILFVSLIVGSNDLQTNIIVVS